MLARCIERVYSTNHLVSIKHSDLMSKTIIYDKLYQAFGKEGLGVLSISDIPRLHSSKINLLSQSYKLISLPDSEKMKLTSSGVGNTIGWSEQKSPFGEIQASFTANPQEDTIGDSKNKNLWPGTLPNLRPNFRGLSQILLETCIQLSSHIDHFLELDFPYSPLPSFETTIGSSLSHLGTLSHSRPFCQSLNKSYLKPWQLSSGIFSIFIPPVYQSEVESKLDELQEIMWVKAQGNEVPVVVGQDSVCFMIGKKGECISEGLFESKAFFEKHDQKYADLIRTSFTLMVNDSVLIAEKHDDIIKSNRVYANIN